VDSDERDIEVDENDDVEADEDDDEEDEQPHCSSKNRVFVNFSTYNGLLYSTNQVKWSNEKVIPSWRDLVVS